MFKNTRQIESVILDTLTWCVRCAMREQLQSILAVRFSDTQAAAGVIRRLARNEEIESRSAVVALPEITKPLFTWSPRQAPPNFHALAWKLEKRWKAVKPRRVILCWATKKGAQRAGGLACFPERATQVEHDIGTTAVYANLCRTQPLLAEGWVGEDILRRDFAPRERWLSKIPDAAIFRDERLQYILEFGGQYSVNRLKRFHQHCHNFQLPYILY
jgi:hypothetical protein